MSEREQFERLKFERWASTLMLADIAQRIDGTYDDRETSDLWQAWQARAALDSERVRELEAERADLYRQIEKVREERNGIRRKVELPLLGKLKEADERVRELEDAARKVTTCLASQVPVYLEELEQALAKGAKE